MDTLSRMTFRNGTQLRYHRLTHTLDLANVMGPRYSRLDRFGSILFYEKPQHVMIELGLGPDQVVVGDGGFFTAFIEWNGDSTAFIGVDSLAGGWGITCRGGCPGSGRIVLHRVSGRSY